MAKKTGGVAQTVRELMGPVAAECGVEIWDVEYVRESGSMLLRVTLDRAGGIDSDTCYHFTELANPVLDKADPIAESYMFEVSSPGLGRRLRLQQHYNAFSDNGTEVEVRTIRPVSGKRDHRGILKGLDGDTVTIESADGEEKYELKDIAYTKLCDDIF